MNAVDTNVLIYSIDAADQTKRLRANSLIESLVEADTVIPWQVACEVAAVVGAMTRSGWFRGHPSVAHCPSPLRFVTAIKQNAS
jgi:predicted nucleic acid-binding protein